MKGSRMGGSTTGGEPSADKVKALIKELEGFTTVKIKDNLKRILRRQP